ncbi:phospholipase A1-like [Temnothorax curvispinosus]|uniref:phospholipase A1 n=1 Tax=Temnothorax curvispinosus TaxID=300111 RepID=A0A6J1Q715_9HYME|nr:phospholipase A1-like [Temnothorax curvispinosus]
MRAVFTILAIFLVQCAYLRAESKPGMIVEGIGKVLNPDSCILGVKSVSVFLYNSKFEGKNISTKEICDNIDSSQQVAFVTHGFLSSGNTTSFRELSSQLEQKGYTVFAMDWSQGACTDGIPIIKFAGYPAAVKNTHEMGQLIASYIECMVKDCGVPLENIILIGHSLGAHISGFAGKEVDKKGLGKIKQIIAADPAKPLFGRNKCEDRLCESDAKCVIVLHTSPLGISKPIGFLNLQFGEGLIQPGCGVDVSCSHSRSISYLTNLLKDNCTFPGVPMKKKRLPFQSSPPYPSSNTTDCIAINHNNILDASCPIKGQFYVFVEKDPFCTQKTFNCQYQ